MLSKEISDKLYSYQINHVNKILHVLNKNHSALDASDTGTGKTFATIAVCKQLKLRPIIIAPKSVLSIWKRVAELFNVHPYLIVNYETIRGGKCYNSGNERVKCNYLNVIEIDGKFVDYTWIVPTDSIFIYDEAHKCSMHTYNGKLLIASKLTNRYILILSATIVDVSDKFFIFAYILNFIDQQQVIDNEITFTKYIKILSNWFNRDVNPLLRLHNMLYPERAARINIRDLGDLFPETQITAESYNIGRAREKQIEEEYTKIADELDNLKNVVKKDNEKSKKGASLVGILRAQQRIELIKIPLFVQLCTEFIENNFSVAIFVNFTKTLETLSEMLNTKCLIYGKQTTIEREQHINDFQENRTRIIICNIKSGSTGISLDDQYGGFKRASIISPTWNSVDLLQALGRVNRANSKSKSIQRIVYVANTVEEKIALRIKDKLKNLNLINNADFSLDNIKFIDK